IMYGFNTIIVTIIALPAMIKISGTLTALVFATFPLVSVATQYFSKQIHERFEQVQEYFSDLTARAQESLSGVRVIRSYSREDYEVEKFKKLNHEFVGRNIGLIKLNALFTPTLHALIGFGPALSLWYGGSLIAKGDLTVGKFVEFNLYLGLLIWPMIALGYVVSLYQRGMASMGRINVVLNTEPAIKDTAEKGTVKDIQGRIEFKGLNFKYKDKLVLKNIDLKIELGQTVAIVGRTGSGKTTLLNLIPRLYEAPHGQVLIDGRPIEEIPLSLLRQSIGYVPQESFLFSNTLAGNIAFGVEESDPKEIAVAAERAGLSTDITDFPKGFETVVGERGITLSGGQKQRVSIARALIRQPKILILDDSLSAVDTETEEKILDHLREVMSERTCLIVSHRISTVKNADMIIVLAEGEIVEQGTHQQLLDKGGLYAELYEKQLLEEELAIS
ncbi:MAG: ABC transporter ATP-binding protein, partial [Blastocatellia bacterium]|nr:ABC transporter ATP-binding protein [Blastocatellia bacterium]